MDKRISKDGTRTLECRNTFSEDAKLILGLGLVSIWMDQLPYLFLSEDSNSEFLSPKISNFMNHEIKLKVILHFGGRV